VTVGREHPTFSRAQHHAFCARDQLTSWPDVCTTQSYGKAVVEVLVKVVLEMLEVNVALV